MLTDELERLRKLRDAGTLSEAEFQLAKQRLLQSPQTDPFESQKHGTPVLQSGKIHGLEERTWCMLMHLSQLLIFAGGIGGAVPIVMWAISKDDSREANRHGLTILNWYVSALIYGLVSGVLCFVVIGIPMAVVLAALTVIFPIIGAVKCNQGIRWKYPLSIEFFDPDAS
ncbi:MAG TPA: DUF4870 domain-containing protein [Planctomycetaceae bacterium]|nr:DUF4870 domain-containing protein [Planctomycetaceae bacterium]